MQIYEVVFTGGVMEIIMISHVACRPRLCPSPGLITPRRSIMPTLPYLAKWPQVEPLPRLKH